MWQTASGNSLYSNDHLANILVTGYNLSEVSSMIYVVLSLKNSNHNGRDLLRAAEFGGAGFVDGLRISEQSFFQPGREILGIRTSY